MKLQFPLFLTAVLLAVTGPISVAQSLFEDAVNYPVGSRCYVVESADFDGDGDLDLAASSGDENWISILMNNGDGTFELDSAYSVGNDPGGSRPSIWTTMATLIWP